VNDPAAATIRVISVYATRWRRGSQRAPVPRTGNTAEHFELGRLAEFYDLFADQLPTVLVSESIPPESLNLDTRSSDVEILAARAWLFALPSDQVVAALTLDFPSRGGESDNVCTVRALEACAYAEISVAGRELVAYVSDLAERGAAELIGSDDVRTLPPERHQVVFLPGGPDRPPPDKTTVDRILYRIDPPYRKVFMSTQRPTGLNQEERTLGAVTPYVSLLYGHQRYVENSVFLTTVQAVGTAARFRQIWHEAHRHVRTFRETKQASTVGVQRRGDLEELVDQLGNLELDLSFSVETSSDLGLLIPSLRIETFSRALYEVMEIPTRAQTVSRMFTRLDSSIASELTAIEIRERRRDERRRVRTAFAVGALTVLGVPLGFLVTFFGINATQVSPQWSMFDMDHYLWVWVTAGVLAILPIPILALSYGLTYSITWWRRRRRRRRLVPEPT
jgi:hypothetical protein